MKRYELLSHTADIEIKVFGKDLQELFANALFGMSQVQQAEVEKGREVTRKIKIKSFNLASLLIDFLSEALYLSIVNKAVYPEIKINKFSDKELEGELLGNRVKRFEEDIKGVTYYGLEVKQNRKGLWETMVVFDV